MINRHLKKGTPWRFGPDGPSQQRGAKTHKGTPCQTPEKQPVGRGATGTLEP